FCGVGLAVSGRFSGYRWPIAIGVAVLIASCFLSTSRGGVAACVVGACVFTAMMRRHADGFGRSSLGGVLVGGLALVGGAAFAFLGAREGIWSQLLNQEVSKLDQITKSIGIVRDYPLF